MSLSIISFGLTSFHPSPPFVKLSTFSLCQIVATHFLVTLQPALCLFLPLLLNDSGGLLVAESSKFVANCTIYAQVKTFLWSSGSTADLPLCVERLLSCPLYTWPPAHLSFILGVCLSFLSKNKTVTLTLFYIVALQVTKRKCAKRMFQKESDFSVSAGFLIFIVMQKVHLQFKGYV